MAVTARGKSGTSLGRCTHPLHRPTEEGAQAPDVQHQGPECPQASHPPRATAPRYRAASTHPGSGQEASPTSVPAEQGLLKAPRRSRCRAPKAPGPAPAARAGLRRRRAPPPAHGADAARLAEEHGKQPTPEGFCHGGEQPGTDRNILSSITREE